MIHRKLIAAGFLASFVIGSCGKSGEGRQGQQPLTSGPEERPEPGHPAENTGSHEPGWVLARSENFDDLEPFQGAWSADPLPDDGPYADNGAFFRNRGVTPPSGFRTSIPFGEEHWLTVESYTRSESTPINAVVAVTTDPAGGTNKVLRIASPAHTDGTVVRSTEPLPQRYRISLRVGFPSFGDGRPGLNGYNDQETAEPFWMEDARSQNGFYWLTILDAQPRPHNNTWIHHHRKVVIDSDNHFPPWMEVFDGSAFIQSGEHPIMMFGLDGKGRSDDRTGKPFLSFAGGQWQPSGAIRAVDAYLPNEWYQVTIERFDTKFTLEIQGRFRYGGQKTYRATIDAAEHCVWHYNRSSDEDATGCVDQGEWPAGVDWPDWFMFGDPHTNYYEGEVYYDDIHLEVWQ